MIQINRDLTLTQIPLTRDAIGSGYMGEFNGLYSKIVAAFGEPISCVGGDGKVQAEWIVLTPDGIATIYDYKEYNKKPQDVTNWHIGGYNKRSAEWVVQALMFHK